MDSITSSSQYGFFPFFSMSVNADDKNSSLTIITVSNSCLPLFLFYASFDRVMALEIFNLIHY